MDDLATLEAAYHRTYHPIYRAAHGLEVASWIGLLPIPATFVVVPLGMVMGEIRSERLADNLAFGLLWALAGLALLGILRGGALVVRTIADRQLLAVRDLPIADRTRIVGELRSGGPRPRDGA